MAPVVRALQGHEQLFVLFHSGQHYDYYLSQTFIEELKLPKPNYSYEIKKATPAIQISRIMASTEKIIRKENPELILVLGDTNTVLATALASFKQGVSVGHVEAGLRSYDLRMPEEHNRRIVDHISAYLFAPTKEAEKNVVQENVWGEVYVTGNTVIDAVIQHMPIAEERSKIMKQVKFEEYALATAHRAENVDDPMVLKNFVDAFIEAPIPVLFPAHPRTVKRLHEYNLWKKLTSSKNVQLMPPLRYLDFLILMKNCKLMLTDSGGLQEEATAPPIRKPVLVIRLSTERPEAVKAGFVRVAGVEKRKILDALNKLLINPPKLSKKSPFGDGKAGEKITEIVIALCK